MAKNVVIVGAGGFGKEVVWLIERINSMCYEWNILGFIDDEKKLFDTEINGYSVIGNVKYLENYCNKIYVVCALGNPRKRKEVVRNLSKNQNINFATVVDPSVIYSDSVQIGNGCIICAGTIATVNVSIADHVIINLDCTVGHDSAIGDYVTIYPSVNISGFVKIKEYCELGTGSKIIQGISIESGTVIGAGSVLIKSITESGTYVGAPAHKIK